MRTISLIVFILFSISACKKEKELIEVDLPEPNQKDEVVYPNPNEVNTSDGPFKMKGLKYQYNDLEPFI
ncbi:MAG TPA: hypothetical protein DDZ41_03065, partial [Flavobacterium sp.]|nr:hypothetical protein [Flavobacterium sp.]